MKIKCSRCTEEHDVSQMEPAFALPDCIVSMSMQERDSKTVITSKNICAIREEKRGFVRVLLPIPVLGDGVCNWGIWVEPIPHGSFIDILDAWTEPELLQLKRPGRLANELQSYPGSLGLPGIMSFVDMKSIGRFELLHDIERTAPHRLVSDQRDGVTPARKLEWLLSAIHPEAGSGS